MVDALLTCTCFLSAYYFYRPQTKFGARLYFYISLSFCSQGGACVVALAEVHAWLLGGHAWLLLGGCAWLLRGVCVVALGGGHVWLLRGHAWLLRGGACVVAWGACMVLFGGACVVLFRGGMHGFIRGGMRGFFSFFRYNEIRSMSGRYASYWNAFLFIQLSRKFVILSVYFIKSKRF